MAVTLRFSAGDDGQHALSANPRSNCKSNLTNAFHHFANRQRHAEYMHLNAFTVWCSHSDDDNEYLCVCLAFSGLWMGLPLNGRMLICVHTRHIPTSSANVVRMHFRQLAAQSNIALEMCRTDAHRNAMQRTRKTIRKTYPQFGRPTPTNYHCWTIYKIGVYMA